MNAARLWRTGRKVGRTIYEQVGDGPSDDDQLIGMMDTPELARSVVAAREVHVKLFAGAADRLEEPAVADDPMRLAERLGLVDRIRRAVADELYLVHYSVVRSDRIVCADDGQLWPCRTGLILADWSES